MEPICIVPAGDVCGEAATWDAAANRLYWTDINRFLLHAYDPAAGTTRTHMFDQPVVALSLTDRQGRLLVALGSQLILFNPEDGSAKICRRRWKAGRNCASMTGEAIRAALSGSDRWGTMSAPTARDFL